MATGRRVTTAPRGGIVRVGGVVPIPTEPFDPGLGAPGGIPATEQIEVGRKPEYFESQIVAFGNLGIGEAVEVRFRVAFERIRIVQRTAAVVLALGYGRTPSTADFDDLIVGAIYFDFPTPPTRDLGIENIGAVALAADLLVIAMTGERYETV